jgi:hypothetical protein
VCLSVHLNDPHLITLLLCVSYQSMPVTAVGVVPEKELTGTALPCLSLLESPRHFYRYSSYSSFSLPSLLYWHPVSLPPIFVVSSFFPSENLSSLSLSLLNSNRFLILILPHLLPSGMFKHYLITRLSEQDEDLRARYVANEKIFALVLGIVPEGTHFLLCTYT